MAAAVTVNDHPHVLTPPYLHHSSPSPRASIHLKFVIKLQLGKCSLKDKSSEIQRQLGQEEQSSLDDSRHTQIHKYSGK